MAKVGAMLAAHALRGVKDGLDYEEYGGAPLLGVRGGVFICHGSSSERAIKNGIRAAGSLARCGVDAEIARPSRRGTRRRDRAGDTVRGSRGRGSVGIENRRAGDVRPRRN